jgi:HEPN domain-containing protein
VSRPEEAVPLSRSALKKLAEERLKDSRVLLDAGNYSGSYHLCGFAVECGLKAIIAKNVKRNMFPTKDFGNKCYTHNLTALANLANLTTQREDKQSRDPIFSLNWSIAINWNEHSRYKKYSKREARELYDAIADDNHGVLSWLANYW